MVQFYCRVSIVKLNPGCRRTETLSKIFYPVLPDWHDIRIESYIQFAFLFIQLIKLFTGNRQLVSRNPRLPEIKIIIRTEIPDENNNCGCKFGCIKIPFEFLMKEPHESIIEQQANETEKKKFFKLWLPLRIVAFECPVAVDDIVIDNGENKTGWVGEIFIPL